MSNKENKKAIISIIAGSIGTLGALGWVFLPAYPLFVRLIFGISSHAVIYDSCFSLISLVGFFFGILAKREKEKFALIGIFLSILGMVGGLIFLCLDSGFIQTTQ